MFSEISSLAIIAQNGDRPRLKMITAENREIGFIFARKLSSEQERFMDMVGKQQNLETWTLINNNKQQENWKTGICQIVVIVFVLLLLSGCAPIIEKIMQNLADKNCTVNDDIKVGDTRAVILFVKHHIFVGGEPSNDGAWDPEGYVVDPWTRHKFYNNDIVALRKQQINTWEPEINKIYKANQANISILKAGIEIHHDPQMYPTTISNWGFRGHTDEIVAQLKEAEPEYIHVLWGMWNDYAGIAAGTRFAVVIADRPRGGGDQRADHKTLAHEYVHALGYEQHDDDLPNNLMKASARGDQLTQEQILVLWNNINENGKKLQSITCDSK